MDSDLSREDKAVGSSIDGNIKLRVIVLHSGNTGITERVSFLISFLPKHMYDHFTIHRQKIVSNSHTMCLWGRSS
jgi:hypothetical protein